MSYDGDSHETRRNAAIAIGVAIAAFAGVGLLYWLFSSMSGPALAVSPTALTTSASTTSATSAPAPSATTEMSPPAITPWTPTTTFSLPPPEAPTMTAPVGTPTPLQSSVPPATQAPAPAPTPATTPAPAIPPPFPSSSTSSSTPAATPAPSISNVSLTCSKAGPRVVAKLVFDTTTRVDVLLSAGGNVSSRSAGPGTVSMTANGRGGGACLASVGGQVVGPVPAT